MATPNQEKTYNEFVKFYDLADDLVQIAEDSTTEYNGEQFDEVEKVVLYLEGATDKLTQNYIDMVKDSHGADKEQEIKEILSAISTKTQECRELLTRLYEKND